MSYNIDTFKIKKMENFVIPLAALYADEIREDWRPSRPEIINTETNEVELECGCEQTIRGILKDDMNLYITDLELDGDGSGSFRYECFDKALLKSKGTLEAKMVWEGGDSITHLLVIDGVIKEEEIEL